MTIYTVHARPGADRSADGADVVLVPDTWSGWAFLFGPFWFAVKRCWVAMTLWVVAAAILAVGARWLGLSPPALEALALVGAIAVGMEANNLWRGALARQGYREMDVVSGPRIEDAERVWFRRAGAARPPAFPAPVAGPPPLPRVAQVGGLFPDAGG